MFRKSRVVLAAVLAVAVAVAVVPLMLDQCAATCEKHHDSVASMPACHHTGTAFHVGHAPNGCGHDHNETLVTADNGLTTTSRPFVATVAVVAIPVNPAVAISQHLRTHAPPGPASTLLDRSSLPFRI
jgi:hypothetical protein